MTATYRCCCGDDERCCAAWCECPDEITVSFCARESSFDLIACTGPECHPTAGTVVGSAFRSVHVTGVKFKKVTGTNPRSLCTNCCWYEVAEGEEQTGQVSFSIDDSLLWCSEKEGDECVYGYQDCVGSKSMPLTDVSTYWNVTILSGYLDINCCNPAECDGQSFKAKLSFAFEAVHADAGTITDCCTQTTTDLSSTVTFDASYDWDCRHQSRWAATCPADLIDESGQGTANHGVSSCLDGFTGEPCPCGSTPGQGSDYVGTCIVDPPAIQYCVDDHGTTVTCTPSGNGIIESIT